MKLSLVLSALLGMGLGMISVEEVDAVVYCQYIDYPVGCVVRAGVGRWPRPVARAVVTPGVGVPGVGAPRHADESWWTGRSPADAKRLPPSTSSSKIDAGICDHATDGQLACGQR